MPIRYTCTTCASVLKIREEKAGTEGRCPRCKSTFIVPPPDDEDGIELESDSADVGGELPAADATSADHDSVDMPIELTPEVDLSASDDFDPMDVLSGGGSSGRASGTAAAISAPTSGIPADRRPSVAELMRDFEATKKKDNRRSAETARPKEVSSVETSGSAADALTRVYQQKRDNAANPKPTAAPVDPDRQLLYDFLKKVIPAGIAAIAFLWAVVWMVTRTGYNGPDLEYVEGTIKQGGNPVSMMTIRFDPIEEVVMASADDGTGGDGSEKKTGAASARGTTDAQGHFVLMYDAMHAGIPAGKYRVSIVNEMGVPISNLPEQQSVKDVVEGDNEFVFDLE